MSLVTCHMTPVNVSSLSPARQAGAQLTHPGGMEGWVDLCGYIRDGIPVNRQLPMITIMMMMCHDRISSKRDG